MLKSLDLRNKTESELVQQLKDLLKDLREKSRDVIAQKEKNFGLPRKMRKDVARLRTILGEKGILKGAAAVAKEAEAVIEKTADNIKKKVKAVKKGK